MVRYAKSSWDHPGLEGFDRPLNKRGMRDVPKMGEYLVEQRILPQIIVSSSALRAHATTISLATATLIAVIQGWDDT
jgi:phosphohistidine phosphatase